VPGDSFYAGNGPESCRHLRLNFSHSNPEQIREGIRRLSLAVKRQLLTSTCQVVWNGALGEVSMLVCAACPLTTPTVWPRSQSGVL